MAQTNETNHAHDAFRPWMNFNPAMMMDFGKLFTAYQVPHVDSAAAIESQRKNLEAIGNATRIAFESAKMIMAKQTESFQRAMMDISSDLTQLSQATSPQAVVAMQIDHMQTRLKKAQADAMEMGEMVHKTRTKTMTVINKRLGDALEEAKSAIADQPIAS